MWWFFCEEEAVCEPGCDAPWDYAAGGGGVCSSTCEREMKRQCNGDCVIFDAGCILYHTGMILLLRMVALGGKRPYNCSTSRIFIVLLYPNPYDPSYSILCSWLLFKQFEGGIYV